MKWILIILFLLIDCFAYAGKYYVSLTGNDSNDGSIGQPWKTWAKGFNSIPAGDTCYFRSGIYNITSAVSVSPKDGTYSHKTCFFNYPGEKPILDCSGHRSGSGYAYALRIYNTSHIYLKGLEIRNFTSTTTGRYCEAFFWEDVNDIRYEKCIAHHIAGDGFAGTNFDTLYFINCDAYALCDTLHSQDPGGGAVGFACSTRLADNPNAKDCYVYYKGCRAWDCSDQGFAAFNSGTVVWDSCWSIHNGFHWGEWELLDEYGSYGQNGNGWKWDQAPDANKDQVIRYMINCIAACNEWDGFMENSMDYPETQCHFYNNFAYDNGHPHYMNVYPGSGYNIRTQMNRPDTIGRWNHCYRNNLSHGGNGFDKDIIYPGTFVNENNYWSDNATVTDADFISLDTTGMCGPRQADGSLPYTLFGHLAPTSNLIDAGTPKTGLPFKGSAPDIGWVESQPGSNMYPSVTITSPTSSSKFTPPATVNIIVNALDGDGTISKVEFFNGTTKLGEKTSNPWSYTWNNVPVGNYSLTVVATDNSGARTTSSAVSISVAASTPPVTNKPPVIAITYPGGSSSFTAPASITITTNASDTDGTISKVEFYNGSTKLGEKTSNPWSFAWNNVPLGTYTLTAVATDNSNARTTSLAVTIIVNDLPPVINQPPVITISNPAKGTKYEKPADITIDAIASDPDGTISKVEFFNGTTELAELTTAPWSFTWKDVDVGIYIITSKATDNLGAATVSSPVDIEVEEDIAPSYYDVNSEILKLYPNPNNGQFTIELIEPLQNERNEINITTFEGRLIDKEILSQDKKQFDLSYLKPGTYILILSGKDIIVTKKFIMTNY